MADDVDGGCSASHVLPEEVEQLCKELRHLKLFNEALENRLIDLMGHEKMMSTGNFFNRLGLPNLSDKSGDALLRMRTEFQKITQENRGIHEKTKAVTKPAEGAEPAEALSSDLDATTSFPSCFPLPTQQEVINVISDALGAVFAKAGHFLPVEYDTLSDAKGPQPIDSDLLESNCPPDRKSFSEVLCEAAQRVLIVPCSGPGVSFVFSESAMTVLIPDRILLPDDEGWVRVKEKDFQQVQSQMLHLREQANASRQLCSERAVELSCREAEQNRQDEVIRRQAMQLEQLAQLHNNSEEIEALQRRIEDYAKTVALLRQRVGDLEAEKAELLSRLENLDSQLQTLFALRCSKAKLSELLTEAKTELEEAKTKITQLEEENKRLATPVNESVESECSSVSYMDSELSEEGKAVVSLSKPSEQFDKTLSALAVLDARNKFETDVAHVRREVATLNESKELLIQELNDNKMQSQRLALIKNRQIADLKETIRNLMLVTNKASEENSRNPSPAECRDSSRLRGENKTMAVVPLHLRQAVAATLRAVARGSSDNSPSQDWSPSSNTSLPCQDCGVKIKQLRTELASKDVVINNMIRRWALNGLDGHSGGVNEAKRLQLLIESLILENTGLKDALTTAIANGR